MLLHIAIVCSSLIAGNIPCDGYTTIYLSIHFLGARLGRFHAITWMYGAFCRLVLSFLLSTYVTRSGIAGSYGKCKFNLVRHCQSVFQRGRTISAFSPAGENSSCPGTSWTLGVFSCLNSSHSSGYSGVSLVFIGVCLVTRDGAFIFMCLMALLTSSLMKYLFDSFVHFKNCVVLLLFCWKSS